jgi:diguanylate cyclase (GGDEF)-like protein
MSSILVLDDRAPERELLSIVLGHVGHTILEASTGERALELARANEPELIIADLMMPGMNGYEFVRELRADPAVGETKVVFCTSAYDQDEVRKVADSCGVSRVLIKPCEPEEIIRVVGEALAPDGVFPPPILSESFDHEQLRVLNAKLVQKVEELEALGQEQRQLHEELRWAHGRQAEALALLEPVKEGSGPARVRLPIAAKFAVMFAVLVIALVAVGFAGLDGLKHIKRHSDRLYDENIVTIQKTAALASDTSRAAKVTLEVVSTPVRSDIPRLEESLSTVIVPRVNADIDSLRAIHAHDPRSERAEIEYIAGLWGSFLALKARGPLKTVIVGDPSLGPDRVPVDRVRAIFAPIEQQAAQQTSLEASQAAAGDHQADVTYLSSRNLVVVIGVLAMLIGAGVMALLIRAVVPRIRRYSGFARQVAVDDAHSVVKVTGNDELSDLGTALNEMVGRRVAEQAQESAQAEFAEVMQLTGTEQEAHDLLKRQIERTIPDSSVVVLNRNNSADRLQATTAVSAHSLLSSTLENAIPRSCLAVRSARTHTEQPDDDPLVTCEVCGKVAGFSTCAPLLVGGKVIGSVLAVHPRAMTVAEAQSINRSVTQAAPVLANLRNLAIAQGRAKTDALTGLPNKRNVADNVKRMVAHASRTVSPLAALALDLDHFKQINDRYGHSRGDEVLAAVGSTLKNCCRASDLVGRVGGEEFLILLPDTGLQAARTVAENIRAAVATIVIPSIERSITASIGIAVLPDQAGDGATLLRNADRALYVAKNAGRNRTETFTHEMIPSDPVIDPILPETPATVDPFDRDTPSGSLTAPPAPAGPRSSQTTARTPAPPGPSARQ